MHLRSVFIVFETANIFHNFTNAQFYSLSIYCGQSHKYNFLANYNDLFNLDMSDGISCCNSIAACVICHCTYWFLTFFTSVYMSDCARLVTDVYSPSLVTK